MPLTCECNWDYEAEPGDKMVDWDARVDFEPLQTKIRKRCASCQALININDYCLIFPRHRYPYNEIEARIHDVDWYNFEEPTIKTTPIYHCEKCGEIWLNLQDVGFECLSPGENMGESLIEYQQSYAPPKLGENHA